MIEGNSAKYFKWLFNMWISAAIGEELLFRSFAFLQFRKIFGEKKIWLVLLSAVMFSLPHLYQGISGLVMTFLFGLAFGFIYLKFNNIWINVIIHGLVDTVFLTLSYYGMTDFYSGF
ncbi:CPBP family intramembrane glutamic endopeptidase [Epilithonimonas zeae]|nr:CPBP family intramembrane glutamic endopeptidase [Epilithonimonas zeae]